MRPVDDQIVRAIRGMKLFIGCAHDWELKSQRPTHDGRRRVVRECSKCRTRAVHYAKGAKR